MNYIPSALDGSSYVLGQDAADCQIFSFLCGQRLVPVGWFLSLLWILAACRVSRKGSEQLCTAISHWDLASFKFIFLISKCNMSCLHSPLASKSAICQEQPLHCAHNEPCWSSVAIVIFISALCKQRFYKKINDQWITLGCTVLERKKIKEKGRNSCFS